MRTARFIMSSVLLVLLGMGTAIADIHPIALDAERSVLSLAEQNRNSFDFHMEIGELSAMDVETAEGVFARLSIPGFHSSKVIGSPEIPMMNRLIEIPFGATPRVEILSTRIRTIDLADFGIEHLLMPAQPSMPKNVDPEDWPFIYHPETYDTDRVGHETVRVQTLGAIRSVGFGRLEVSPVEYLPRTNQIVVHEAIDFRLHFDGADHMRGDQLKAAHYSPFFEPTLGAIAGYSASNLRVDYPDLVQDVVTLVIITPAAYVSTLQDYIDWKTERGFTVVVGEIGSPEVGTTTTSIQSFIHGLYNSPPAGQAAPSFAVFVGDVADCPTFYESGDATDRPFCAVDGDTYPDIYYGRLSCTGVSQLQDILDKTLMYDEFTMPDPSFLGEVVMTAGYDASYGEVWGNGQINYGTVHYFNAAHGITSHTYLYPESGSSSAAIIQNVDDGVAYVNYTAHGSETSWSNPSFTQSDINGLSNYGEYCLAVGNCCLTGSYDYSECFGETWLRAAGKGAIGYIGGSNSTMWDEDYWWGVGSGTVVVNPVYADFGLGAYDGIFHDHGEEMDAWYVTNDAIIFRGNMAVTEAGGDDVYYWNIYNLSGDPSISTYMGVPSTHSVTHPTTLFTTSPDIAIGAEPGSYVGLTQDGVIQAAGTVGITGTATFNIATVLTPGSAYLVVMAQNKEPYKITIPVIVPATIIINPDPIDANVTTDVVVEVYEADGVTPKPGIDVWADGLGYTTTPVTTDAAGLCTLSVNYPYGPDLDIVGQEPGEAYLLFTETIGVNALAMTDPDLSVTTTIGLTDTFALNLEGELSLKGAAPSHTLWAIMPDGTEFTTTEAAITVTPGQVGDVTGIIACSGYDLYTETFPVIEAYGTLTGTVDANGSPAVGAVVEGHDAGDALTFEATVDALGDYDVGEDILVAPYVVKVDYFGFLHYEQSFFINYGPNVLDIVLSPAPSGVLTGTIKDSETADPLYATVKVYRSDTMELYTQTVTDSTDGSFTTSALPYFDYVVTMKAWHHKSLTTNITIEDPVMEKHYVLEPTNGDFLVIDDNSVGGKSIPAKYDEKTGDMIEPGFISVESKAAADIVTDLENIGYAVTLETAAATDPLTWGDYDLIIVSCGNNTAPVADATFRANVEAFVAGGGHLLIEGGEVGYDAASYPGYPTFAENVLHTNDWNSDSGGDFTVGDAEHYLMSVPNTITGPISMASGNYADQDAQVPSNGGVLVGSWSSYPTDASLIAYDPNAAPEGGQIAFYCFNYSSMDAVARVAILENTMTWLMALEIGDCSVSGTVTLAGQSDHSGIRVDAVPGGGYDITGVDGSYSLPGLYAGTYDIIATKDGWSTDAAEVTLSSGENLTGVDLSLSAVITEDFCNTPSLAIPDNNPTGVSDAISVGIGGATVSGIEVYVDITHTYQGDLIVDLTSPDGTTVILHNRTGGSVDDILGWYPSPLVPDGDLDNFIGENTDGDWTLHISDNAGADTGILNEWCVRISYGVSTGIAAGSEDLPKAVTLKANVPNPFNPQTTISFDLPRKSNVDLAVYELSGRRVATLASGSLEAGSHNIVWRGRDDSGRPVASGMYFYRLSTDEETFTRKMVLLK